MTTAPNGREAAVELSGISVRYRVPEERILSFKEYVLRRLTRGIRYRELWAIRDLDLTVPAGSCFGIVGRNGAGKSTLLRVVARVLSPTQGRVVLRGRVAPLLELGAGFHPDLTGRENIYLNATLIGHTKAAVEKALPEVIDFSELADYIDLPIRGYSNGMLARLGFAVATMYRPDILIVDEMLAVGDAGFQQKCLARIDGFRARGTTTLLVSHDASTIERLCERVAWLEHGQLVAQGTAAAVLPRYRQAVLGEGVPVGVA